MSEQNAPTQPSPNMHVNGDQARVLMAALVQVSAAVQLYVKLQELSLVQPPREN